MVSGKVERLKMQCAGSAVTWHSDLSYGLASHLGKETAPISQRTGSQCLFSILSLSLPLFLPPLIFQVLVDYQMGSQANASISAFASPETKYNFLL